LSILFKNIFFIFKIDFKKIEGNEAYINNLLHAIYFDNNFQMNFLEFALRSVSVKKILSVSNLIKCFKLINNFSSDDKMSSSTLNKFL